MELVALHLKFILDILTTEVDTPITIIIISCYLIVVAFVFFNQRNLLYHPFENNYNKDSANFSYEEIFIPTSNENNLKAWFHKKDLKQKKTLVFFHGNAGHLRNRIYKLNMIKDFDINFLIVAYRGFSGNQGEPSEKGLYEDARDTLDWLKNQKVKDNQIIIYGEIRCPKKLPRRSHEISRRGKRNAAEVS